MQILNASIIFCWVCLNAVVAEISTAYMHTGKVEPHNQSGTGTHIVRTVIHALMTARDVPLMEVCLAVTLRMSLFHVVSDKLLYHV